MAAVGAELALVDRSARTRPLVAGGLGLAAFSAEFAGVHRAAGALPLAGGRGLGLAALGTELAGVSRMTADACDGGVYIPMSGRTESLNASAAAAIILWEMKRSGNG